MSPLKKSSEELKSEFERLAEQWSGCVEAEAKAALALKRTKTATRKAHSAYMKARMALLMAGEMPQDTAKS